MGSIIVDDYSLSVAISESGRISRSSDADAKLTAIHHVLNGQQFAKLPPDDRRSFLFGLMNCSASGKVVAVRLKAKGVDDTCISQISPFLRAGFETAAKEAQAQARECKAQWKTVTGGETYGGVKAGKWAAEAPSVDTATLPDEKGKLKDIDCQIASANQRLGKMEAAVENAETAVLRRCQLEKSASSLQSCIAKLKIDEDELKKWSELLERSKAIAGVKPRTGLLHELARDLKSLLSEFGRESCPSLAAYEKQFGTISSRENDEAAAAAFELIPQHEKSVALLSSACNNDRRDITAAQTAVETLKSLDQGKTDAPKKDELIALRDSISKLVQTRMITVQIIREIEDTERLAQDCSARTAKARTSVGTVTYSSM